MIHLRGVHPELVMINYLWGYGLPLENDFIALIVRLRLDSLYRPVYNVERM